MLPVRSILSSVNATSVDGDAIDGQQLVHWFQSLETSMKHSLEQSIFSLFDARIDEHVERCLGIVNDPRHKRGQPNDDRHPLQSILVVEHLLFERRLQKLMDGSSKAFFRREQYVLIERFAPKTSNVTLSLGILQEEMRRRNPSVAFPSRCSRRMSVAPTVLLARHVVK